MSELVTTAATLHTRMEGLNQRHKANAPATSILSSSGISSKSVFSGIYVQMGATHTHQGLANNEDNLGSSNMRSR